MKTSIFSRIFGAMILVSVVVVFLVTFLTFRDQVNIFHNSVVKEKSTLITFLKAVSEKNDGFVSETILEEIAQSNDVVFFWIVDEQNVVRYARDNKLIGKEVSDPFLQVTELKQRSATYNDRKVEVIASPIRGKNSQRWIALMGIGRIGMITFFIPALFKAFVMFLGAVLVSVPLSLILTERIVSPLLKLKKMIAHVRQGEFNEQIDIATGDEIEIIGNDFNQLIEELQEHRRKLEETNQILEVRVQARTKELQELADTLEDKAEAKTEELQRKVEELEKFHRLTVGREKKMIELKEENSKLLEENKKLKDQIEKIKTS